VLLDKFSKNEKLTKKQKKQKRKKMTHKILSKFTPVFELAKVYQ